MFKWKVAIFTFIGGGFTLSLLIGLIAGNPFGVVFLRSLLSGIVIGGIGTGIVFIFNKYFTELVINTGESAVDKEEKEGINIVLPEENPHIVNDDDTIEEVEEVADEMEEAEQHGREELEPLEELEKAADIEPIIEGSIEEENSRSDVSLPDLDSLATDSLNTGKSSVSLPKGQTEVPGMETDPEILAKAVRSIMKKDEEG